MLLGGLIGTVTAEKNGLVNKDKWQDVSDNIYFIANNICWIRIAESLSSINIGSSIITVVNEWNNTSPNKVVFISSLNCRDQCYCSILEKKGVIPNFIDKIRYVKSGDECYLDVHYNLAITNKILFSFGCSLMVTAKDPEIVPEDQQGYSIEVFNL